MTAEVSLVATEVGMLHQLRQANPGTTFLAMNEKASCRYMKMTTPELLLATLRGGGDEVHVDADVARGRAGGSSGCWPSGRPAVASERRGATWRSTSSSSARASPVCRPRSGCTPRVGGCWSCPRGRAAPAGRREASRGGVGVGRRPRRARPRHRGRRGRAVRAAGPGLPGGGGAAAPGRARRARRPLRPRRAGPARPHPRGRAPPPPGRARGRGTRPGPRSCARWSPRPGPRGPGTDLVGGQPRGRADPRPAGSTTDPRSPAPCSTPRGGPVVVRARAVVLATGGIGSAYAVTTNPSGVTGEGAALALLAGATLRDVEFVQFHPTALHVGRQGRCRSCRRRCAAREPCCATTSVGRSWPGSTPGRPRPARRGPRVHRAAREAGEDHVWLDATGVDGVRERFPTITAACATEGLDPARDLLPVSPAEHFWCGGRRDRPLGATDVPGPAAVGEVAATGVHGGNRLASNSLLEGWSSVDAPLPASRWSCPRRPTASCRRSSRPRPGAGGGRPAAARHARRGRADRSGAGRGGAALADGPARTRPGSWPAPSSPRRPPARRAAGRTSAPTTRWPRSAGGATSRSGSGPRDPGRRRGCRPSGGSRERPRPAADAGLDVEAVLGLVRATLAEDVADGVDLTSTLTVPADARLDVRYVARQAGTVAGLPVLAAVVEEVLGDDARLELVAATATASSRARCWPPLRAPPGACSSSSAPRSTCSAT